MKELIETLKQAFPHGHPEFIPLLVEKAKLHSDKNFDYARGGNPLGNFTRVATIFSQYPNLKLDDPVVVMLTYAMKQIDAVLWGLAQGGENKVEGPIDRLSDVLVYSGIAICALKDRSKANTPKPPIDGAPGSFIAWDGKKSPFNEIAGQADARLGNIASKQEPEKKPTWTCPDCGAQFTSAGDACGFNKKNPYVKAA